MQLARFTWTQFEDEESFDENLKSLADSIKAAMEKTAKDKEKKSGNIHLAMNMI